MRSHRLSVLGCAAVLAFSATQLQAGVTYDAVNDFSLSGNPNGTWSYGSLSSFTGGTFTSDTATTTNIDFSGELVWTNGAEDFTRTAVVANTSDSIAYYYTIQQPPDLLNLAVEGSSSVVRWTAPASGTYNVSGLFQRIDTNNAVTVNVAIVEDAASFIVPESTLSGFGDQNGFNFVVDLQSGETLDFAAFNNGNPSYDSTGLSATITAVPEPTMLTLLVSAMLGLAGAFYLRRRRAKA